MTEQPGGTAFGPAASSTLFQLAVAFNDALDRCTQTGGATIEEVMAFFADDAIRVVAGWRPKSARRRSRPPTCAAARASSKCGSCKGCSCGAINSSAGGSAATAPRPRRRRSATCASC